MIKKSLKCLTIAAMSITLFGCGGGGVKDWPDSGLATKIPEPDFGKGEVELNEDYGLRIELSKVSTENFSNYVKACKKNGYDALIKEEDGSDFEAFNKENYKIDLDYDDDDKKLTIRVDPAIELKKIEWPSYNKFVKNLPKPKSNIGYLNESSSDFRAVIGDVSKEAYDNYVKECQTKGYIVDYDKSENSYEAYNKNGYHIYLDFQKSGLNTMSIQIYPKDDSDTSNDNNSNDTSDNEISADFKKAMDSYEKFFDEYISFMKKYKNASDPSSMLKDFNKYTDKYTKMMKDFKNMKSELSDAELEYYTEVQLRISKKLLEVQ